MPTNFNELLSRPFIPFPPDFDFPISARAENKYIVFNPSEAKVITLFPMTAEECVRKINIFGRGEKYQLIPVTSVKILNVSKKTVFSGFEGL